ncbi:MAG: hypothetical protein Q7S66_04500 [bacterium]|nr:hypothetical protein [bacterium]
MRLHEKQRAIVLRRLGKSYAEIQKEFPYISKSTLSRWLSALPLTKAERANLESRLSKRFSQGLTKANRTNHAKKLKRIDVAYKSAQTQFEKNKNDPFFISGLMMYWAEGSKTTERVQFANSDYRLVLLMIKWFKKYLNVSKLRYRLYIHKIYEHEKQENFWKQLIGKQPQDHLGISFKPATHGFKRNPDYRGCMRVDAGGVANFYTIKCWQEKYTKKYKLSPSWCNG